MHWSFSSLFPYPGVFSEGRYLGAPGAPEPSAYRCWQRKAFSQYPSPSDSSTSPAKEFQDPCCITSHLLSPGYLLVLKQFTSIRVDAVSHSSLHPLPSVLCLAHKTGWWDWMNHNIPCHSALCLDCSHMDRERLSTLGRNPVIALQLEAALSGPT